VLKKCSRRKGIKGFILRKDLLTKIKQCDVELSNVLQAFQVRVLFMLSLSIGLQISLWAELLLDVRVALIAVRLEVKGTLISK
jgi:hypothetical protein